MSQPSVDPYFQPPLAKEAYTEPPRKGHGCFFWGCIFSLLLLILIIIGFFLMGWLFVRTVNQAVEKYTQSAPMELPKAELAEDQVKSLDERLDAFKKSLDNGEPATLELTGDEL